MSRESDPMVMHQDGGNDLTQDARVRYAVAVLLGIDELDEFVWPDWLDYSADERRPEVRLRIVPSDFFGSSYAQPESLPALPLKECDGTPLIYGEPPVERKGQELVVHADIVASSYFLLTRYEEIVRRDARDEHGRFPGKDSLPYRAGFIDRPLVDEYSDLLRKWAAQVGVQVPRQARKFSVRLTHDVDSLGLIPRLFQPVREMAKAVLGRQSWRASAASALISAGLKLDPFNNLEEVVRLDQLLASRVPSDRCNSSYFFLAGDDGDYDLTHPAIRNAIECVKESGATVGLHTGYEAGADPALVRRERERLEATTGVSVDSNRHHYLAWREPEHGHQIAAAGIQRDYTLGYADVAGFRLGVCHPVPMFDAVGMQPFGFQEHPLIVMDCTLSFPKYMNLGEEEAFEYTMRLADATYRHGGEFVMLWHNTMLASSDGSYNKQIYVRLMDYLARVINGETA